MREGLGEIEAAAKKSLPRLVELQDIRGVLHCHSQYSDGKATIAEMAEAARAKGWSYLGISDHSQAAFYASGVLREAMLEQHDEIDALNAKTPDFRVLKGVEADILADGGLDYDEELLSRFDYVIASIHSRFKMDGAAMTERVLRAMDSPYMTILAHPTGRLLLSRDAYAIDVDPLELRLRNYAMTETHSGKQFSSKYLRECYRDAATRFGWERRNPKPRSMQSGRYLVGWGLGR